MGLEVKRERLVLRAGGQKWEWHIEPRYWRNPLIYVGILVIAPVVIYFAYPPLLTTVINANLLAAIAIPLALMTIGTGRMNFGPQFYIGIGGYTAALLSIHSHLSPGLTMIAAALGGLVFGFLMSPLSIIAGGLYYSLLTLLFPLLFLEATYIFSDLFKGDTGLSGIAPLVSTGFFSLNLLIYAFISLTIMLVYLFIIDKIFRSRYAIQMAAINDDEEVANGIGVNVNKVKIISFAIPAMMVAIIGWFYAHYYGAFSGQTYLPLSFMLKVFMVTMIGGRTQIYGCIIGGYFISILEMLLIRYAGDMSPVLFPIILLALLLALPEGLFGLYRKRHYREYMPTLRFRR
ncbi:MAG: branched-chain amino acid ABC transporter permease [Dehalococcoidia bacterium]|jgi:branched-chain amino acid transport system permease protein|nr:branched-chain amino acid ABC transporter permease [Dehalococcoidia bacterium]